MAVLPNFWKIPAFLLGTRLRLLLPPRDSLEVFGTIVLLKIQESRRSGLDLRREAPRKGADAARLSGTPAVRRAAGGVGR